MELTKEEIYIRKEIANIYPQLLINAKKTCGYAFDKHGLDLIAVCVEFFLSKPLKDQLRTIENNKLENFLTFMMAMQLKSGSSRFYYQYRKHHEKQRELYFNFDYGYEYITYNDAFKNEKSELLTCLECEIDKLDPYLKMLVKEKLIEQKTYVDISTQYDINYTSLKKDTNKAIKQIKLKCQDLYTT
tara:strand:- start:2156 stop:2716 length:561 start_codon:yes stop_codon:yes gene_type:complete